MATSDKSNKEINKLANKAKTNASAFGEIYDHFAEDVYAFFYHRTNNNQGRAEDLVSVTFEKILKNISKYDETKSNFSTWIYTISQNTLTDHYRKQKHRDGISLDSTGENDSSSLKEKQASNSSPSSDVITDRNRKIINLALSKLPQKDQLVITLKYMSDLTYKEIGQNIGCSSNAVGVRISRALKKLTTQLKKQGLDTKLDLEKQT
ncbi:sigma-70 family RNA polymerase sigma factor [Candidatus Dojkabacteria bacterium]|nr:sigma-70 family RNA polymerase sigma factor [Candidatus Dojkabacteria bacterium]